MPKQQACVARLGELGSLLEKESRALEGMVCVLPRRGPAGPARSFAPGLLWPRKRPLTRPKGRPASLAHGFGLVLPTLRRMRAVASQEPSSHVILFLKMNQTLENSATSRPGIWELAASHPTNIFLKGALYVSDTWAILR